MKETILLFNAPAKEDLLKIEMALFPLHIRLKKISREDYSQPLGVLAGMKDMALTRPSWPVPSIRSMWRSFRAISPGLRDSSQPRRLPRNRDVSCNESSY